MRIIFRLLIIICFIGYFNLDSYTQENTKILFIGNSHTYTNDLPRIFKRIADSKEDSVEVKQIAFGGYKFSQHINNQQTLEAINEKEWDYVVLQEGIFSTLPVDTAKYQSYPYALMLKNKIKLNCSETKVILYMVQSYPYGTTYRCPEDPVVCTYEGMYSRLVENNFNIGNLLNATIAPCTVVWDEIRNTNSSLSLWANDYYHPSPLGSYISACAIYASIFKRDLNDVFVPSEIDSEVANMIHEKVQDIILNESSNWNEIVAEMPNFVPYLFKHLPTLNIKENEYFSYQINPYVFIDDDTLQISVGLIPSDEMPEGFIFDPQNLELSGIPVTTGTYYFKITAKDYHDVCVFDTLQINVQPATSNFSDKRKLPDIQLKQNYPNPFHISTQISYSLKEQGTVKLEIFDSIGQHIKTLVNTCQVPGEYSVVWDGTDDFNNALTSGVYFYSLSVNEIIFQKKIILLRE